MQKTMNDKLEYFLEKLKNMSSEEICNEFEQISNNIDNLNHLIKIEQDKLDIINKKRFQELKEKYNLLNFIGKEYFFTKPQKWTNVKKGIFNQDDFQYYNYMKLNGVYSGEEINSLNIFEFQPEFTLNSNDEFVLFAIPDEDYYESFHEKTKQIPLSNTWEILFFKI